MKMGKRELEKELLKQYPCPKKDPLKTVGVLLSNEIEYYVNQFKLIDPFNQNNLKPAGYELTAGNEYSIGGETMRLFDEPGKNEIKIPPFEVAVIKAGEKVNLPRFLIARWNIRVKWAYEGLLWVGGPQVDAGYVGPLLCPIYNLSDKEVILRLGEPLALIDFIKTTPFKKGCKEYERPPKRVVFDDYNPEKLKSALYTEAKKRIGDIEKKVDTFGTRLDTYIGIIFAAISVIVAALSIFVSSGQQANVSVPLWLYSSVILSITALIISIFAYTKARSKGYNVPGDNVEERIRKLAWRIKILAIAVMALTIIITACALSKYLDALPFLPFSLLLSR
jgi:deoxycytidine triphosphate deaminase